MSEKVNDQNCNHKCEGCTVADCGSRVSMCRTSGAVKIEYCGEHSFENGGCLYCGAQPLPGSGTPEDPYVIDSVFRLKDFRNLVNGGKFGACAVLTADINLKDEEWTAIVPYSGGGYYGVFDGAGYTVSGLNAVGDVYSGLLGAVDENGVVKDLSVIGRVSGGEYLDAGGVAGVNYGTVINCSFSGSVSASAFLLLAELA